MSFYLALINGLLTYQIRRSISRHSATITCHPLDIVISALVKWIDDGHKLLRHLGVVAGID